MVRKTKTESAQTREAILDAAEVEMMARGVTHTSLDRIARRANVTRGAIYWHFADKPALLEAMIQRTKLPLRDLRSCLIEHMPGADSDPLNLLREMMLHGVDRLANDEQHRRVCHIVLHRCEMTDQGHATGRLLDAMFNETRDVLYSLCRDIAARGQLREGLTVINAVDMLISYMAGMYQCSLRHPEAYLISDHPERKIDALFYGLFDREPAAGSAASHGRNAPAAIDDPSADPSSPIR
ncbi:MAG: TetR family transcriptional regulator [Salinisphaera sp.]|jgi:TetR/AcrR family transcriptional repressor of mexAB-oprM operon|nr:TetR family transcriptional regulator [Salinisphaera sp.]